MDVITTYVKDHMSVNPQEYRGKLKVVEYYEGIRVIKPMLQPIMASFLDHENYLSFMFCAILVGLY